MELKKMGEKIAAENRRELLRKIPFLSMVFSIYALTILLIGAGATELFGRGFLADTIVGVFSLALLYLGVKLKIIS